MSEILNDLKLCSDELAKTLTRDFVSNYIKQGGDPKTFKVTLSPAQQQDIGFLRTLLLKSEFQHIIRAQTVTFAMIRPSLDLGSQTGTDEMEEEVKRTASKTVPPSSLKTIGGYFSAAKKVYEMNPVYHPKEGIVTFPTEISLSETELVLINRHYLEDFPNKIPPILYNKLVPI